MRMRTAFTILLIAAIGATPTAAAPAPSEAVLAASPIPEALAVPAQDFPDLIALRPWDFRIELPPPTAGLVTGVDDSRDGRTVLRFATSIGNVGAHSLELLVVPTATAQLSVLQCVNFFRVGNASPGCRRYVPVASMEPDPASLHLRIPGLVRYRLLRDRDGRPDTSEGGTIAVSTGAGTCFGDDHDYRPTRPVPRPPVYAECHRRLPPEPVSFRQGITPWWASNSERALPGQNLALGGASDGVYWVEVAVNQPVPGGGRPLRESNYRNNVAYRRIQISENRAVVRAE